jgi:hypothetical protein
MSTQTFYCILTVKKQLRHGVATRTLATSVEVAPGATRGGLLRWAFDQMPAQYTIEDSNVLFFSVEPYELMPAASTTGQGSAA